MRDLPPAQHLRLATPEWDPTNHGHTGQSGHLDNLADPFGMYLMP
jgi:hypothetical protein